MSTKLLRIRHAGHPSWKARPADGARVIAGSMAFMAPPADTQTVGRCANEGVPPTIDKVSQRCTNAAIARLQRLTHRVAITLVLGLVLASALLFPVAARADTISQCVSKLGSCAENALKTVGQSLLTVGHLAVNLALDAQCVAAMSSGNPPAIGVTGLVVGLGAAGVVNPNNCEADIYGVAAGPVSEAIDAILPGFNLAKTIKGQSLEFVKTTLSAVPAPSLPPTVGGLIDCGCGALHAGAQAVEDVRKVAKFAAATAESCGAAIDACPGLKQIAAAAKGVINIITDPSSIVQSCESMSRHQYIDARLRDLIPNVVSQFHDNIAWSGSNMEVNHWIPRQKTCYKYYDSHCYKEDDAKSFCNNAVYEENFDPMVWDAIIAELNGPQFDKYFKANAAKLAPAPACPKDPGGSINIDPNAVDALEQVKGTKSANSKACSQEMVSLVSGDVDSLKTLAHDFLPTTRAGWAEVRLKTSEKPIDNANKVFLRVMTAAAAVTKAKMAQVATKYAEQDAALTTASDTAAVPYIVLNQRYAGWAAGVILFHTNKCPADPKGWAGQYELQCVQEFVSSLGFQASTASQMKLDGVIVATLGAQISQGSFKGSRYYNTASDVLMKSRTPRIRVPGGPPESAAAKTERYEGYWKEAAQAATAQFLADAPAFFAKQNERALADKTKRQQQDEVFTALLANNKIESDYAQSVCQKLKTGEIPSLKFALCNGKVAEIANAETGKFNVSKAGAFLKAAAADKPALDADMSKAVSAIKTEHDKAIKLYADAYKAADADPKRVLLASVEQGKAAIGLIDKKPADSTSGKSPGDPNSRVGVTAAGSLSGAKAAVIGDTPVGLRAGVVAAIPPGQPNPGQAVLPGGLPATFPGGISAVPEARIQKLPAIPAPPAGAIGMPALPTMGSLPQPPKGGTVPRMAPGLVPPAPTATSPPAPAVVAMQSPPVIVLGNQPPPKSGTVLGMTPGVAAALAPPFDAKAFRADREKALGTEWLPQCKGNAGCTTVMTQLMDRRINTEVQAITAGNPDHKNKVAVAAFIDQLDTQYDPQFQALIPKPVFVANDPPVPSGTAIPKAPPKIPKKLPGMN